MFKLVFFLILVSTEGIQSCSINGTYAVCEDLCLASYTFIMRAEVSSVTITQKSDHQYPVYLGCAPFLENLKEIIVEPPSNCTGGWGQPLRNGSFNNIKVTGCRGYTNAITEDFFKIKQQLKKKRKEEMKAKKRRITEWSFFGMSWKLFLGVFLGICVATSFIFGVYFIIRIKIRMSMASSITSPPLSHPPPSPPSPSFPPPTPPPRYSELFADESSEYDSEITVLEGHPISQRPSHNLRIGFESPRVLQPYVIGASSSPTLSFLEGELPMLPTVNWPLVPPRRLSLNSLRGAVGDPNTRLRVFPARNPTHYVIDSESGSSSQNEGENEGE